MHWQCEQCGLIHRLRYLAQDCCPADPDPVADDMVVYCWRCKGDRCDSCNDRGIMFVHEVQPKPAPQSIPVVRGKTYVRPEFHLGDDDYE